jgi:hypothetical protein
MSFVYSFVATKNNDGDEYANFMQSYTSQTFITLTKTNTQEYILNGGYVHLLQSLSLPVLHMCIFRVSMSHVVACSYFDSQIAGLRRPSSQLRGCRPPQCQDPRRAICAVRPSFLHHAPEIPAPWRQRPPHPLLLRARPQGYVYVCVCV